MTHGGVTAQVSHGGTGRQTRLARALHAVETVPLDDELGRRTGVLLARSGVNDAVDAALAAIAAQSDQIITTDPNDLAAASDSRVDVAPI